MARSRPWLPSALANPARGIRLTESLTREAWEADRETVCRRHAKRGACRPGISLFLLAGVPMAFRFRFGMAVASLHHAALFPWGV